MRIVETQVLRVENVASCLFDDGVSFPVEQLDNDLVLLSGKENFSRRHLTTKGLVDYLLRNGLVCETENRNILAITEKMSAWSNAASAVVNAYYEKRS